MNKIFAILFSLFLLVSCHGNSYQDNKKESKELRIVSLAPSITKELEYLGLTNNIVGATSYCNIAQKNPQLIVGTTTEVNIEKILLLKPDIVFASGLTSESAIKTLQDNGIKVHFIDKMQSFDEICREFLSMAKEVNKKALAEEIVAKSRRKIDSLNQTIPPQKKGQLIFFQIGAKPLFAVIPNTFMDDYITFAGCKNMAYGLTKGTINRESVLTRNPDIIIVVTMGILGQEEKQTWEQFPQINAVKNNKIFVVDSNIACMPSVIAFTEAFEDIVHKIYQ